MVAEVVNCNKLSKVLSVSSFSYTAPMALNTALGKSLNKLGLTFLADRTNGRAIVTVLRLSVVVVCLQREVLWLNGTS